MLRRKAAVLPPGSFESAPLKSTVLPGHVTVTPARALADGASFQRVHFSAERAEEKICC